MKSEYQTRQRVILLSYLKEHSHAPQSVSEICECLCSESDVGKSTVYRLLPKLAEEGLITRFYDESQQRLTYQYVDVDHGCDRHYHLKCAECGKTVHLEGEAAQSVLESILRENAFDSDERHTVLLGKCKECRNA